MSRISLRIAALAVGLAAHAPLIAQQSAAAEFQPLAFLVGSCWRGTFPDGRHVDEHCFDWMYDGKFIRDRHEVRGGDPYRGETVYSVDPLSRRVAFWYWSSDGMTMTGQVVPRGDTLVFPVRYTTAHGEAELKAVWTRRGPDAYHVVQSQRAGDGWTTMWEMDFRRVSP